MVTVIESFLPADDFRRLQQITRPRRGGRDVYGKLKDMAFLAATRRCIAARVPAAADLSIQQVLLRFEGRTGLLHHDLNGRPRRRLSLLLYIDVPAEGGALIFPFFDASGAPVDSPVTAACRARWAAGDLYSEDPLLAAYLTAHQERLLTLQPSPNSAVFFPSDDPAAWHFVSPVIRGHRSCLVFFFQV